MHEDSAAVIRSMEHLVTPTPRSKWWIWVCMGAGLLVTALVVSIVALAIIALDRGTQVANYRTEQRCRADVNLELILGVVDVVDELATVPRDQPALDAALAHLHVVRTQARELQETKACGFSGSIPSPADSVNP